MKLLSLWEPWATLMALGAKRIETRSWDTPYRGWLAIHAAKHFTADEDNLCFTPIFRDTLERGGVPLLPYRSGKRFQFDLGCIVAVVNLLTCCDTNLVFSAMPSLDTERERAFGNYESGRYAWVTTDLFRLPSAIPFKGKQGLIDVPEDVLIEVRRQRNGCRVSSSEP